MPSRLPAFVLLLAAALVAGCGRHAPSDEGGAPVLPGPAGAAGEHHPIRGEVLKIEPARHVLVVRHDAVPGSMPAMAMEFFVAPGDIAAARVGERIRADMILGKGPDYPKLERIWPDDQAGSAAVAEGARALREDTHDRGDSAYREVGEAMPAFTLYDQNGRVVTSGRFRGKQVMLNFIFTRCPVANMCPASTAKMIAAQRLAREAGVKNIEFVSITLDPTYDTPGVLREYADVRGIDLSNFSFLTGPESAVRDLLTQFGVIAEFQGDLVKHTLATLLIDPRGTIVWRADGSIWDPADFVARMRKG